MSNIRFSFTQAGDGTQTIVLIGTKGQGVRLVPATHAKFDTLRDYLLDGGDLSTEDEAFALADAAAAITEELRQVSERVQVKGDTVLFDGMPQESRLTRQLVDMVRNGDGNVAGYAAFLENLNLNTSKGRKGLFKFVEKNGLAITPRGTFIAYKAVAEDGKSVRSGAEDVTVTLADDPEHPQVHKGRIPNPVGATIAMARNLVDDDRDRHCSVGLHVGTRDFADTYSPTGKFLTVEVNPRDVVETPSDNPEKVRVCRYTVLDENQGRLKYEGTSYLDDEEDDYQDEDAWWDDEDDRIL